MILSPRANARGSALLEAVIGLAILGIAAAAIVSAVSQSAGQAQLSEETIAAAALAARLANVIETSQAGQAIPMKSGNEGIYNWQRRIQPAQETAVTGYTESPARLYQAEVSIRWRHAGRERNYRLHTLIADVPDAR